MARICTPGVVGGEVLARLHRATGSEVGKSHLAMTM